MSYNLFKNTSILYFVLVMLGAVVIAAVMKSLMRVKNLPMCPNCSLLAGSLIVAACFGVLYLNFSRKC